VIRAQNFGAMTTRGTGCDRWQDFFRYMQKRA